MYDPGRVVGWGFQCFLCCLSSDYRWTFSVEFLFVWGGAGRANNSALNFFHIMFLDQNQQIEWVVSALQQNIRI